MTPTPLAFPGDTPGQADERVLWRQVSIHIESALSDSRHLSAAYRRMWAMMAAEMREYAESGQ